MGEREFEFEGFRVVIGAGSIAIDNRPACDAAHLQDTPGFAPEPQRIVISDRLIDAIGDRLPSRQMREEGRA